MIRLGHLFKAKLFYLRPNSTCYDFRYQFEEGAKQRLFAVHNGLFGASESGRLGILII
jgi:hypothetical protein